MKTNMPETRNTYARSWAWSARGAGRARTEAYARVMDRRIIDPSTRDAPLWRADSRGVVRLHRALSIMSDMMRAFDAMSAR